MKFFLLSEEGKVLEEHDTGEQRITQYLIKHFPPGLFYIGRMLPGYGSLSMLGHVGGEGLMVICSPGIAKHMANPPNWSFAFVQESIDN